MFKQVSKKEYLPERISKEIKQKIVSGELMAGEKLPGEHKLASDFGVSRSVVREAIAQLRYEGLLETHQGSGAFVKDLKNNPANLNLETTELKNKDNFANLFQLRLPIEVEAAGLAAIYRDTSHLAIMQDTISAMEKAKNWKDESVHDDLRFHQAISSATKNEYYIRFLGYICEKVNLEITALKKENTHNTWIDVTLREHREIYQAVYQQDIQQARYAMYQHIVNSSHRMKLKIDVFLNL